MTRRPEIDFADVQGLVRFGHGRLSEASFFLLEVADAAAARRWLQDAPVTSALATDPPPDTALQVAFTRQGLDALGVSPDIVQGFAEEFIAGMASDEGRSRRLGDVGANDPSRWRWGASRVPHLVAMLYAVPGGLDAWEEAVRGAEWDTAFRVEARLDTFDMGDIEPFGFADGISQPRLDWDAELSPEDAERADYSNLIPLGEVLLGYPNAYGRYTGRPLIDPVGDRRALDLPPAEDRPYRRDLGRNGSYLVFRQLHQDVRGFWQFLDRAGGRSARGTPATGRGDGRPHTRGGAVGAARNGPDHGGRAGTGGPRSEPVHLCGRPERPPLPLRRPRPARQPAHGRSAHRDQGRGRSPGSHARLREIVVPR